VGALSSRDLAVLHRAIEGDNTYSLGAIVARRLHLNKTQGKIHGGIYATRLAAHCKVEIRPHDFPLTKVYLDRAAMDHHHFTDIESPHIPIPYNLVFSVMTCDVIPLRAPALFDSIARGGYMIMPEDIVAYRNNQAAAKEEPQEWYPQVPAPQHFNEKVVITKLGGVRMPTDITFMLTHFIPVVGVHTFSLYYPC